MNIAIASDDRITIASHFGKTRGFLIFNVEKPLLRKVGMVFLRPHETRRLFAVALNVIVRASHAYVFIVHFPSLKNFLG